jgi:hypothetical protein
MAEILNIDFNQLPRATRERFIAITEGKAGPAPIFQDRSSAAGGCGWFLLMGFFGLGSIGILAAQFGEPYEATQPVGSVIAYVILFFLAFLGLLGLIKSRVTKKTLPYASGVYVFPLDTVVARDRNIRLLSAREITNLEPVHHHRNGVYTHTLFTLTYSDGMRQSFAVYGKPQADAAMQRLRAEGAQGAEAMARRDANMLYPLDPLFEARMAGFQPTDDPSGPQAKTPPGWTKKTTLFAFGAAALLAPVSYGLRNLASDEVAFNEAESSYEYEAYLRRGWRHIDEVRDEYLPRAKLKEAAAKTDVTERIKAIKAILAEKLIPTVQAEGALLLKAALHAAFEQSKAAGTVSALREFQKSYPEAEDVPAAKARIHELFEKTLADFRPRASKPGSVPFVEALLAYMEKNDSPPLEVRFRRHNSRTLDLADKVLARGAGGEAAMASIHFEPADAAKREGAVIDAMQKGFGGVFPTDVLPLTKGDDLDPNDKSIPGTSKASVFVDYTVGWSGATYTNSRENRQFVGIVFEFDVLMTIPNNGKLLKLKFKVMPPNEFTVSYDTFTNPAFGAAIKDATQGPSDSLVYEVMALRAFDELSTKVQDEFFVAERPAEGAKAQPKGAAL